MTDQFAQLQSALAGRYSLERKLGHGGMANVYLAEDLKHERAVAVKVLRPEVAALMGAARFLREIKTTAKLQHPRILTLIDSGEAAGTLYYVMPYVEGESLRGRLIRQGRLPLKEALAIATGVASALSYAHDQQVIHRDIKPENVLLHHDEPVVADFGVAIAARSAGGERLTETGLTLGTPAYMSPEQIAGDRDLDNRTDVYSLGCVVFEMLTGTPPHPGPTVAAIFAKQLAQPAPPLTRWRQDTPAHVDAAIRKALATQPDERFASTKAFAEALVKAGPGNRVRAEPTPPEMPGSTKSIVVLPFTNLSSDPEDAYFSDGLTDELITDLSRSTDLRVVSSASAFRLKGSQKSLGAIGEELRVRYALAGRVRKSGQDVRITAQLVDVRDESPVWAEKYAGSLASVFELQEQVSRSIAAALEVQLKPAPSAPSAQASEAYLQGRHFFRQATGDGLLKAVESFQRTTEIDPNFAPAFSALAYTYVWLTAAFLSLPAAETMPKARAAARRSVELDPNLPEAHTALALVATFYDWDLAGADRAFREALRLNPDYADAHGWYTAPLIWLDTRFGEALAHACRAVELNPLDPWARFQLHLVYYFSRDFDRAITAARELIELEPLWGTGHYHLGVTLATMGRVSEAIESISRGMELDSRSVHHVAWLGCSHAIAGRRSEALERLEELETHEREGKSVWAWKLPIYSGIGSADDVMRCLLEAFEERSASLVFHLTHPLVDCVRDHPRFTDLLGRMNLEHLATYRPQTWLSRSSGQFRRPQ